MRKATIAFGIIASLLCGTFFSSFNNMVCRADETNAVVSGGAVSVPTYPEVSATTVLTLKKDKSLKKAELTWMAVADVQGYYIMRKTGKGEYQNIASVTELSYSDGSVKPGLTYTYQVIPWQGAENESPRLGSCTNEKTISLVPGKVKGLKVKKRRGKFTVTWKKTSGATGYQVYTKVFVKGIKTKYNKAKTLKSRKYKRGMLVRKMKYGFKVRAYKKVNGKKIYGPFSTVTKRY